MSTFPVRFVVVHRRSSTSMSSQGSVPSKNVNNPSSFSAASAASASSSSNPAPVVAYKTVWDFEKIEKQGGPDNFSKVWHCGWCGLTLRGWNATKALNHVSKASGSNDVKACSGAIPKATLVTFQAFRFEKLGAATVKKQFKEALSDTVSHNQQSISVMLEALRSHPSNSCGAADVVDMTGRDGAAGGVGAKNATKLTAAIAEFVYSKGLSFSAIEGDHFLEILKLSRLVSTSYRPPTRKTLANELLDLSYETRLAKYMHDLDIDAEVYGLSLFGDGATVHGMPLMNILASGVGEPSAVLAIIDCKFVFVVCFYFYVVLTIVLLLFILYRYRPSCRWWKEGFHLYCRPV